MFQLSSTSAHLLQPLGVYIFGVFKRNTTAIPESLAQSKGVRIRVVCEAWPNIFTAKNIIASCADADDFPVNKKRD